MKERFSIIDFTTNTAGDTTVIDEPMGWDAISLHIMRDKTWHGFFDAVDDSVSSLKFVGDGYSILNDAHELKGVQADVKFLIEFQCAEGDAYEQLYYGQFLFSTYKSQCGDLCLAECGVEAVNCMMQFRNRYDQQVDLDSLTPFDPCICEESIEARATFDAAAHTMTITAVGDSKIPSDLTCLAAGNEIVITDSDANDGTYTILSVTFGSPDVVVECSGTFVDGEDLQFTLTGFLYPCQLDAYDGLNYPVILPSKIVQLKNDWKIEDDTYLYEDTLLFNQPSLTTGTYVFPFEWGINVMTEINDADPFRNQFQTDNNTANPIVDFFHQNTGILQLNLGSVLRCAGDTVIDIQMTGQIDFESAVDGVDFDGSIVFVQFREGAYLFQTLLQGGFGCAGCNSSINAININQSITINMQQGDQLYLYFIMANVQYITGPTGVNPFTLEIRVDTAELKITTDTVCNTTICNIYKINEVMSRCVESYTNDCMRVYSDYFGRTDAQPYPSVDDGCGGQRSIANGKKIRNAPNTDGATAIKMTVSMKDTFEALNATDNIGMGLEVDPNRADHNLIRVEPVHYFFNNTILMECPSMRLVKREVEESIIYSIYRGGYEKWETWNDNGLYDLFGDREYRTQLSQLKNTLMQTCRWIASDYAIEFTRRLYGTTTSDWKYDDDIFFLCFKTCWTGTIAFTASTKLINISENPPISTITPGDIITISGTVSNDGTYTVNVVTQNDAETLVFSVLEALVNEVMFDTATICDVTHPLTAIETGIDSPSNILFPETVLNYRLAPSRNAMRWIKTIFQSYRGYTTGQLIFTQGGGNILGEGLVKNDDGCRLENDVIQEQEDLTLSLFIDPTDNYPNFKPELITFEYPMSYQEYLTVVANPYGLIGYQCGSADMQYGWIEDMKYTAYTGMVNFTLRPKIEA